MLFYENFVVILRINNHISDLYNTANVVDTPKNAKTITCNHPIRKKYTNSSIILYHNVK